MRPMALLGLDVGTGGSRAEILDADRLVTATATESHAGFDSPRTRWAQQLVDWSRAWQVVVRAILATRCTASADIRAVGLSGQMHGAMLLDAVADAPKHPLFEVAGRRRSSAPGAVAPECAAGLQPDRWQHPGVAVLRFCETMNFLCKHSVANGYVDGFALNAKPNEPSSYVHFATVGT